MTGAGMMDCKAALSETAGDMEAAVDWLRKKGLSKAAKKADRVAAEGLVGVAVKGTKGVVVEVNSETDFVARNDLFQGLVKMIANVALDVGADVEKIKAAKTGSQHHRRGYRRDHRQDRREHDAAPRRRAFGRQGRDRQLRAQRGDRRRSARSACWSRWNRPARPTSLPRSAGRSRCMSPRPIRRRSIRRASIRRWSSARRTCSPKVQGAGQARRDDREDRRVGPQDLLQGGLPARSAFIHDDKKTVAQALKEAEGKVGGADQGHRLRALRARRGHREAGIRFRRRGRGRRRHQELTGTAAARGGRRGWPGLDQVCQQARLPPRDREGVGRSAVRARRLRHPPADHRPHRQGSDRGARARRHARRRGRRRQHPSRRQDVGQEPVAADRRLDGHAGDRDERPGAGGRDRAARRAGAHHVGAQHAAGLRDLRARAGAAPFRGEPRSWCSPAAPAIRSSPPTPPRCCAPPRWNATPCSRPPTSTASTAPTRRRTRRPSATTGFRCRRRSTATSRFWMRPPSRLPAKTVCLSSCSRFETAGAIEAVLRGKGRATVVGG